MYFVFHPVHRQSVQGANILVTRSSVHLLLLLGLPLLFLPSIYAKTTCFISLSSCISSALFSAQCQRPFFYVIFILYSLCQFLMSLLHSLSHDTSLHRYIHSTFSLSRDLYSSVLFYVPASKYQCLGFCYICVDP